MGFQPGLRGGIGGFEAFAGAGSGAAGDVSGMGARRDAGSDVDGSSVCAAVAIDGDGAGSAVRTFWAAAVDTGSVLRGGRRSDRDHCAKRVQTDSQKAEK